MSRSPTTRRPTRDRRPPIFLGLLVVALAAVFARGGPLQPESVQAQRGGLTVTKTDSPDPVAPGGQLTYTINVTNPSPTATVTDVFVTDSTTGLTNLILTVTAGSCSQSANSVSCGPAALAPGQTMTMTVRGTVNAPVGTTINNTATASGVITTTTTTTVNGSATASTLVGGAAPGLPDLTIAIQAPASTPRGGTIVYTVTVQNQGGTNVTGAVAVFNIPAGLTFVSAIGSSNFVCTNNAGQVTCTGGAITAGGNATITVQASVPAAQPLGPVTATAAVDPNNAITESNEQNNTAQAVTQIVAPRGGNGGTLVIQKTANPSPTVLTGQQLTYQIVVTNTSSSPATNVTVTDNTSGLNNATIVANTTLGTCAVAANVVTCSVPGMTPQQVMTITITGTVTAAAGATITNTATVTGTINGVGVNNSSTATTQVAGGVGLADLVVTKSGPQSVTAGQQYAYTLTVSNLGGTIANGVTVQDTLPAGVQLQSAVGNSGFMCLARVQQPQAVCTGGSIAAGGSATLTLTVLAPNAVGSITNTAVVDPQNTIPESNEGNNTGTFTIQVTAVPGTPPSPLAVFKNGTPNPVVPGQTLTWTIDITNISSLTAGAITVSDGTTGLDAASVVATSTIGSCTVTASQVNCSVPGLPAGQSMQVVISGTVVAQAGTSINNTVDVSGLTGRTAFTSTAQATVNVRPQFDLNISKSNTAPVIAGAPFQYIITVGNSGLSQVTGVEVRDVLPPGVIFVSAVAPDFAGGCTAAGQVVTCTGGTIPASSTVTITLNVTAPQTTGTIVNTATVDPNNTIPETDEMNNSTTLNTVVVTGIDLIPTKCDGNQANNTNPAPAAACPAGSGPDPVAPLGTLTYNLVISNIGTQNATAVEVLDVLPVEVTFVSATGTNGFTCTQAAVNVTCTGGVINFGTSATITIVVTAPNMPTTVQNDVTVDPNNTIPETNEGNNIATALTVVAPVANLQTVKCDGNTANDPVNPNIPLATRTAACAANAALAGPDPVAPGTPLRYILVISNTSALAANNVLVRDSLPPGVTFTNAVGTNNFTCFVNGTFIDCSGGNIPAMSVATITINVAVNNNVANGTILTNQAVSDPLNAISEVNELDNTDQSATTVQANIDLSITKTDTPDPVAPNATLTYTLTVTNSGAASTPPASVVVTDQLPAGVTFQSGTGTNGFTCIVNPALLVTCSGGTIAGAGGTATITIVVLSPAAAPQTITNQAVVDPNNTIPEIDETNNTASATTAVQIGGGGTFIDLTITKAGAPNPVAPGGTLTYTIAVTNGGTSTAFNVAVRDFLPAGTTFVSVSSDGGAAGFSCGQTGPLVIDCLVGSMAMGVTRTITLTVLAPNANGTIINNVSVDPDNTIAESDEQNNAATASTVVQATIDLSVVKTDVPDPVAPNATLTYTLAVAATGAGTANNVVVVDNLPTGFMVTNIAPPVPFACNQVAQTVTCTAPTLTAPYAGNIVITGTVTAAAGTVLTNTATIDPANIVVETNEANNSSTVTTTVTANIDLTITKMGPATAAPGATITYTLTVTNNGAGAATGVVVRDTLPVGVTLVSINATNGFACAPGPVINCTNGAIAGGGGTATITIVVTVNNNAPATLTNTAVVDPDNTIVETNESNNTITATTTVTPNVDLTITKTGDVTPVPSGTNLVYTITVANTTGTGPANNVLVRDYMPLGVTILNVNTGTSLFGCIVSFTSNVIDCTGNLAAGGSATITIQVLVLAAAGTTLNNVAIVDPFNTIAETNEGNNGVSLITPVS